MSLDLHSEPSAPIGSLDELVGTFRSAERPGEGMVGLEHEKLLYRPGVPGGSQPAWIPYDGRDGIGALLEALAENGYERFRERPDGPTIALLRNRATVSLEPGGQFELSGTPFFTAREAHEENVRHVTELERVADRLGLKVAGLGYRPFGTVDDVPWMPKARYETMRRVLPTRGALALDMMLMTATAQVSLDFTDEADCASKVTTAAWVQPLVVALYANSPLRHGRPSGYATFRSRVWKEVDPSRCGTPAFMLDGSFSYRAYLDWALDAPMLFLRRNGHYLVPPLTFRRFIAQGFEGQPATHGDFVDHLSTLFPEVRLKRVIELRGADSNGVAMTGALAALWRGLLYSARARAAARALLDLRTADEHAALLETAQLHGLRGELGGVPLWRLASELIAVARAGLAEQRGSDGSLLDVLAEVAASGHSPADWLGAAGVSMDAVLAAAAL